MQNNYQGIYYDPDIGFVVMENWPVLSEFFSCLQQDVEGVR
jgi:hypothetical protein